MKDEKSWIAQVRRVRPPEFWDDVHGRTVDGPRKAPQRMFGPTRTALVLAAAFAVVGLTLFALSGLNNESDTKPVQPAEPSEAAQVETEWFRVSPPAGWTAVVPSDAPLGEGFVAAQLTNFDTEGLVCVGDGPQIPQNGVLLRLTMGSELEWEGNLVLPAIDPRLKSPSGPATFIDDCGATEKLFVMFFGPDGQVMTAHALLGATASTSDKDAIASVVASLEPTGHEPVLVPGVATIFAESRDSKIGHWVMTLRLGTVRDGMWTAGGVSFFFWTEHERSGLFDGAGLFLEGPSRGVPYVIASLGDGQLVVTGVAPREAAEVSLEVDGGLELSGTIVPLPEAQLPDRVAFWVGPFTAEFAAEGTEMTPGADLVILDDSGNELERVQLPQDRTLTLKISPVSPPPP